MFLFVLIKYLSFYYLYSNSYTPTKYELTNIDIFVFNDDVSIECNVENNMDAISTILDVHVSFVPKAT